MRSRSPLLYRAILSHLIVAVPPAALLGWQVLEINRQALLLEVQHLNLAIAAKLKERFVAAVDQQAALLGTAERILDMSEVPLERRLELLRALVADGKIAEIAIYTPDGHLDSSIRPNDAGPADATPLAAEALAAHDRALEDATFRGEAARARLLLPWSRGAEKLGYIGTTLDLAPLSAQASAMVERYLGEGGEIEVIDGTRHVVVASRPARIGHDAGADSAFASLVAPGAVPGAGAGAGKEAGPGAGKEAGPGAGKEAGPGAGKDAARPGIATIEAGSVGTFIDGAHARRLSALTSAPELGWVVAVSRPEAVALASLFRVRTRVLLLSLLAALAAGFVGLLLARAVTEPLRRLIRAVVAARQRGFRDRVEAGGGKEVHQLVEAFNEVLVDLDALRADVRRTSQIQLRLARFLPATVLREVLTSELEVRESAKDQPMTVMYVDIAAPEEMKAKTVPENLVTMLGEFFAAACSAIERHGGRLDRYSGDAVIGVFIQGDEHARAGAAVAAAADILQDVRSIRTRWGQSEGVGFDASIGVVSGVGLISTGGGGGEVSALGEIVERAASLQAIADRGSVLADAPTRAAAGSERTWTGQNPTTGLFGEEEVFRLGVGRVS